MNCCGVSVINQQETCCYRKLINAREPTVCQYCTVTAVHSVNYEHISPLKQIVWIGEGCSSGNTLLQGSTSNCSIRNDWETPNNRNINHLKLHKINDLMYPDVLYVSTPAEKKGKDNTFDRRRVNKKSVRSLKEIFNVKKSNL